LTAFLISTLFYKELINMMEEEVKGYFEYLENKDDE